MAKRALLVGCNYPDTQAELRGCTNDVKRIKGMLTKHFGFEEGDITVFLDTDPNTTQPTGANIKEKLTELVGLSRAGDVLFVHYSGHGVQLPSDDQDEQDGYDEAIVPTDLNAMTDDDFRQIIKPLDPSVKFTMVADCCHSGTLLDQPRQVISGRKDSAPAFDLPGADTLLALFSSRGLDTAATPLGIKDRSLPKDMYLTMLSGALGKAVEVGQVRSALTHVFGQTASVKAQQFVKAFQNFVQHHGEGEAATGEASGGFSLGSMVGALTNAVGGGGPTVGGGEPTVGGGGQADPSSNGAAQSMLASPAAFKLHEDAAVLVTGCQAGETSADACPDGDPTNAYGALSNAIVTVVDAWYQQHPGQPISAYDLVHAVREMLLKAKFEQNPCLECSDKNAQTHFILA